MSIGENKALVRRWFDEVWNKGNEAAIDEMYPIDGVLHGLDGAEVRGREAFKTFFKAFRESFSEGRVEIDHMVAEGDVVAVRWTRSAVQSGPYKGLAPTNGKVCFSGMLFLRIADGRLAEGWNLFDAQTIVTQIESFTRPSAN